MTPTRPQSRRAFSLIELLIVILIIAMVVAIVLPALSHARKAARNAATRELMSQVQTACSSFILSERRMPGYFTAAEMGNSQNATEGFTGMENVMFDLAGGIVTQTAGSSWACGPNPTTPVWYNPDMVGVAQGSNKAYFTPPSKYFQFQDGDRGARGPGTKVATDVHKDYIRDLVDAEGTPLLLWSLDKMAVQPVAASDDFAFEKSDGRTPPKASRFYWNANAAFLKSATCGVKRINQMTDSLLGLGNTATPDGYTKSLLGVLGNPSSPVNVTAVPVLPSAPRGQFVIQAAGSDAIFVAKGDAPRAGDRGGKIMGSGNLIDYGMNFRGQPKDLMSDFDDIIIAGG
jgi:prepilin-type N-terminal cleavage/methylation domain-containing protein